MRTSLLHGKCYALAIALNRELGWPMVAPKKKFSWLFWRRYEPWHVAVRRPGGLLHDARGAYPEEEFGIPFKKKSYTLVEITEEELLGDHPPPPRPVIAEARRVAEVCWPELPWPGEYEARVARFQRELRMLDWLSATEEG